MKPPVTDRLYQIMAMAAGLTVGSVAQAQSADEATVATEVTEVTEVTEAKIETKVEEIVITGSLRSLPGEDVNIFGFGKSLLETPRSASTISFEQMDRFNITDIDELVMFAPGTFTQSFFGVAGSLDIRGTQGENYFRGIRRIDNPGNYATPIGASDRIDIVRGPASPIMGPSKIGGYLNYNPKSARSGSGDYQQGNHGSFSYETGSWQRSVAVAEVAGPLADRAGFYLYGEFEDSDSFYDNTAVENSIIQASFHAALTDRLQMEFGGMYHDYRGNQVAGWNRLTQALIDDGTYVSGSARPLDTDGDGRISHGEYFAGGVTFFSPADINDNGALVNPGIAKLDENNVLVDPEDLLDNETVTLYLDFSYELGSGLNITNKLFYESLENLNENTYGFSQFGDVEVVEERLVLSLVRDLGMVQVDLQLSPSIRHTEFTRGEDFINEYFDRRDLSLGPAELDTSLYRRILATQIQDDFSEWQTGDYTNYGMALLGNFSLESGISATIGLRQDYIYVTSSTDPDLLLFGSNVLNASDSDTIRSWSFSLNWDTAVGLVPYFTAAEQSTMIAGQMGDVPPSQIANDAWNDVSELREIGLKGSFLNDSLYFALDYFEQKRTDFNSQAIVTNSTSDTSGIEAELRWVVNPDLVVTAGWTDMEVIIVEAREQGSLFGFAGAGDLTGLDPASFYGGVVFGNASNPDGRKAGIPENIFSLSATYSFTEEISVTGSVVDVDSTPSGMSGVVILPAYTLVNFGITYESEKWLLQVNAKNLTDERYFRANFPTLFGSVVALPELPRNFQARVSYKF